MNTWFQFKQFTVHQNKSAMKVCTDACLFGAWIADKIEKKNITARNILDIGCGTGLLSLMVKQKSETSIDAVEIEKNAFEQAKENVVLSKWSTEIKVHHLSINDFITLNKYDLIICNPPFYEDQLKSKDIARNEAMHATSLSFLNLSAAINNNLANNGIAAVLLPHSSYSKFEQSLLSENLFINEVLHVSHSPNHLIFRYLLLISKNKKTFIENRLSIKNNENEYTETFKELLKDYYLQF